MDLLKDKVWTVENLTLFKSSAVLFGILIGLSLPRCFRKMFSLLVLASTVLAVKPLLAYLEEEPSPAPGAAGMNTPSTEL